MIPLLATLLAQSPVTVPVHPTDAFRIEQWVAAGGTYGLIVALLVAVRYLVKRDEKSTSALVEALGAKLVASTGVLSETKVALAEAVAKANVLEQRIASLEQSMRGRCPFVGQDHDPGMTEVTARALAQRLLRDELSAHPRPPGVPPG